MTAGRQCRSPGCWPPSAALKNRERLRGAAIPRVGQALRFAANLDLVADLLAFEEVLEIRCPATRG